MTKKKPTYRPLPRYNNKNTRWFALVTGERDVGHTILRRVNAPACVRIRVYNILYAYNLTMVRGCPIKPSSTITRRAPLITLTHRHTHTRTHAHTNTHNRTVTMTTGPRHLHISPKIARGLFLYFPFFLFLSIFTFYHFFPYFSFFMPRIPRIRPR